MTDITTNDITCDRCDRDLTDDVYRHLDDGGAPNCAHCGCGFEVSSEWLAEHGYNVDEI